MRHIYKNKLGQSIWVPTLLAILFFVLSVYQSVLLFISDRIHPLESLFLITFFSFMSFYFQDVRNSMKEPKPKLENRFTTTNQKLREISEDICSIGSRLTTNNT